MTWLIGQKANLRGEVVEVCGNVSPSGRVRIRHQNGDTGNVAVASLRHCNAYLVSEKELRRRALKRMAESSKRKQRRERYGEAGNGAINPECVAAAVKAGLIQ